jgi:drug/metabolite transporter (DMT)-like permease
MALFGVSPPLAKLLVGDVGPVGLAGLLYLGAFAGMAVLWGASRSLGARRGRSQPLERADVPWLAGATVAGGIVAPIALMSGLALTTGFAASLLLNLEGVATALIAAVAFREHTGPRLWGAVGLTTAGAVLLSWDPATGTLSVAGPALLVLAGACWGLDNNLTRHISLCDPVQIAMVKGLVAGSFSTALAFAIGQGHLGLGVVAPALALGALSYGASLALFVHALRGLGAARAGAFFGMAPFLGAAVSLVLLREWLGWVMLPAAALMAAGAALVAFERHSHVHAHHGVVHCHEHAHDDGHHDHPHDAPSDAPRGASRGGAAEGTHAHEHSHDGCVHDHPHWPDAHHRHGHEHAEEECT